MTMLKVLLLIYLTLSLSWTLVAALWLAWEDLRYLRDPLVRARSKFGRNYSCRGMWWVLLGVTLPVANLWLAWIYFSPRVAHLFRERFVASSNE